MNVGVGFRENEALFIMDAKKTTQLTHWGAIESVAMLLS